MASTPDELEPLWQELPVRVRENLQGEAPHHLNSLEDRICLEQTVFSCGDPNLELLLYQYELGEADSALTFANYIRDGDAKVRKQRRVQTTAARKRSNPIFGELTQAQRNELLYLISGGHSPELANIHLGVKGISEEQLNEYFERVLTSVKGTTRQSKVERLRHKLAEKLSVSVRRRLKRNVKQASVKPLSLEELRLLAEPAMCHEHLIQLAASLKPSGVSRALGVERNSDLAKAARYLAAIRRDHGQEAFDATIAKFRSA